MDDNKDLELRDKFALAAMQSLIIAYGGFISHNSTSMINGEPVVHIDDAEKMMPRIATLAYKMANYMRKVRLASFE